MRNAVRNALARAFMHRRLWLNDPDCIMARTADTGLGADEARTLAAVAATAGGMVVFSDDVDALPRADAALVRETLELARELDAPGAPGTARALAPLGDELASGVAVRGAAGGAIALVNASDETRRVEFDLDRLGVPALRAAGAKRLGTRSGSDASGASLRAELAPHQSSLRRLRAGPVFMVCTFSRSVASSS